MKNWLRRWMYGRYGFDQLSGVLVAVSVVFWLLDLLLDWWVCYLLSVAVLVLILLRMLSRNLTKRQAENGRLLTLTQPLRSWLRRKRNQSRDPDHEYFQCPSCGQLLRVPRGKGTVNITCRRCGTCFQRKT